MLHAAALPRRRVGDDDDDDGWVQLKTVAEGDDVTFLQLFTPPRRTAAVAVPDNAKVAEATMIFSLRLSLSSVPATKSQRSNKEGRRADHAQREHCFVDRDLPHLKIKLLMNHLHSTVFFPLSHLRRFRQTIIFTSPSTAPVINHTNTSQPHQAKCAEENPTKAGSAQQSETHYVFIMIINYEYE